MSGRLSLTYFGHFLFQMNKTSKDSEKCGSQDTRDGTVTHLPSVTWLEMLKLDMWLQVHSAYST